MIISSSSRGTSPGGSTCNSTGRSRCSMAVVSSKRAVSVLLNVYMEKDSFRQLSGL